MNNMQFAAWETLVPLVVELGEAHEFGLDRHTGDQVHAVSDTPLSLSHSAFEKKLTVPAEQTGQRAQAVTASRCSSFLRGDNCGGVNLQLRSTRVCGQKSPTCALTEAMECTRSIRYAVAFVDHAELRKAQQCSYQDPVTAERYSPASQLAQLVSVCTVAARQEVECGQSIK